MNIEEGTVRGTEVGKGGGGDNVQNAPCEASLCINVT